LEVIQLSGQLGGWPGLLIDLDAGKGEEVFGLFEEKCFEGKKKGFAGGFCDFRVFCGGKNGVSLWWIRGEMWCFVCAF